MTRAQLPALAIVLLYCTTAVSVRDWRAEVRDSLDADTRHYGDLSRRIWEAAEPGYKETRSSALLIEELRAAGFDIESGVAGMPTAFVASWGEGRPVFMDPAPVSAARTRFEHALDGREYRSRIPADAAPPLDDRDSR